MVVGSLVQALSINGMFRLWKAQKILLTFQAGMYVIARLLLGFGIPFCIIAGSSLMGELAYPKERPIMTSLFNALWFVGSLIVSRFLICL